MKIIIQTPGFTGKPELLKFADDHVQKLGHLSPRIQEGKVVLHLDKSDTKQNKVCNIHLGVPGNDLFAAKTASTFEEAIAETCQALRKQIESWKEG